MFNESVKKSFIASYTNSGTVKVMVARIFTAMERFEIEYGMDFAEMDVEQAQVTVNAVSGLRSNNANALFYILKGYVKWYAEQGYPASNAIKDVHFDSVEKMRNRMVGNPMHLKMSLDAAFSKLEENSIGYIYRTFLWLAFMGFNDCEAISVRQNEIDFERMLIRFAGNTEPYQIYAEAVPDLLKARDLTEFVEPRGNTTATKARSPGDLLLRGKVSRVSIQHQLIHTFRPTVYSAFKNARNPYEKSGVPIPVGVNLNLTYCNIYASGIFYRTYERERIGIPPRFDSIVLHERTLVRKPELHVNYTENKIINAFVRGYEIDYQSWKRAFS